MGDSYYPLYERNRRGSSPGRRFDRPPPAGPRYLPRSYSNMDPRLPNYNGGSTDPRKRNASQSPDGAQPRKQQRQDHSHDNGPTINQIGSRRSSGSNGTANARPSVSSLQSPHSPHSRRPSLQPPNGMRKPSDAPAISSPRSPYESTVSGRSTPQQRPSTLSKETTATSTHDRTSTVDPNSLTDLLTKFSSDIASRAALEYDRRVAEAQYSSAQREFNALQKHFPGFPSVMEHKSVNKDVARDALRTKEKSLLEQTSIQQSTIEVLTSLLKEIAAPKPRPDLVSRDEYESLKKDYLDLKEEVTSLKQLRSEVDYIRATADQAMSWTEELPDIKRDVSQAKEDGKKFTNWRKGWDGRMDKFDQRLKRVDTFDERMETIGGASTAIQNSIADLKDTELSRLATKGQVTGLEKHVTELEELATTLQKQHTEREKSHDLLSENVANLQKAQAAADDVNSLAPAKNQGLDSESKTKLEAVIKEQSELKEQVQTLLNDGTELFKTVEGKMDQTATEQDTMKQTIDKLGEDVVDSKEKITTIQESIEEEGKDAIVKRVKRLDLLVNNLSLKIQDNDKPPLLQRVNRLEMDCQALQHDSRTPKNVHQLGPTPDKSAGPTIANPMSIETRLLSIENELKTLAADQGGKDALVFEAIDMVEEGFKAQLGNLKDSLNTQLGKVQDSANTTLGQVTDRANAMLEQLKISLNAKVEDSVKSQLEQVGDRFNAQLQGTRDQAERSADLLRKVTKLCHELKMAVEQSVNDLQVAIQSKASTESIQSLKNELSAVSLDVEKLQAHHQRTKSTSQAAPSAANVPQQFSPQPQQMPNGTTGSPQVNGSHSSPYATPYPPGQGSVQQPPTQEMQNMQIQIYSLASVTQQLKMRCDNLQSDDIVRTMVDQFSTMYPEARNFNTAVLGLRNNITFIQQQITLLQQQKAQPVQQFSEDVKRATATAEGANTTAHTVWQEVQKAWQQINTIKEKIKTLETEVDKSKTADPKQDSPQRDTAREARINAEVTSLRSDLTETTRIASDAHKLATDADGLSKQHSSRFSKVLPEETKKQVVALEKTVAALEGTVQEHTQTLGEGTPALKNLQASAGQAQFELERVKENMGAMKGRVELLEQGV